MPDFLSRRSMMRKTAALAALPVLTRCARRVSTDRELTVACPAEPRLTLSPSVAPELSRPGGAVQVRIAGQDRRVLVANTGSGFIAVDGTCSHAGCPVAWVPEDREVECPCHLSRFASDGTVLNPPARNPLASFPVTADAAGNVIVDLAPGDDVFPPLQGNQLTLTLAAYPSLQTRGGAVLGFPRGHEGPLVVARLDDGGLVAFDGTCTHLGCTVHPAQTGSLHCPCHGSTFSISPDLGDPQHPHPVPGWARIGPAGPPLATFPLVVSPEGATATITFPAACASTP